MHKINLFALSTLKIVAINYLNTAPFIYGLKHSGILENFSLEKVPPAQCAQKFIHHEADIALVPIASLPMIIDYQLLQDFCIGTNKQVKSVLLLSPVSLKNITTIYLDPESLTTNNLAKVLTKFFWKQQIKWETVDSTMYYSLSKKFPIIAIGDKAFELQKKYAYSYDMAEQWNAFTKLPFVFACWVCKKNLSPEIIKSFTSTLQYGVKHKVEAATEYLTMNLPFDPIAYIKENIDYNFDNRKKDAVKKFFELMFQLD